MRDFTLGRLRVSAVVERAGPTRPTWLLPDAAPEALERHREWLAPHFLDEKGRLLQSIHAFVLRAPGMTLVLNEIHMLDGLNQTVMIAAADRRISKDGKYHGTYRKLFPIPYLNGAISYFGLASYFDSSGKEKKLWEWLPAFITKQAGTPDLRTFCRSLHEGLENFFPSQLLADKVSGFQICGYNDRFIPEYWFLTNIRNMAGPYPSEIKSFYKAPAPHFIQNDARRNFNWDGEDPASCKNGIQIYRNGDFRGHVAASEHLDAILGQLWDQFPDAFQRPSTLSEYAEYVRYKLEFIAGLYKTWARDAIIGRPIDVLAWSADARNRNIRSFRLPDRA